MRRASRVVLDRVRERGPGEPERRQEQHHRRRDADADRVEADLGRVREPHEEEAVREVRHPEEERGRDERDPEAVHLAQQAAVELEPELLAAVADERGVDEERAREVADDDADRALVEHDDEEQRRADRQEDVREARRDEGDRALLDAEERRELLVVHPRPEPDERGRDELCSRRTSRRGRPRSAASRATPTTSPAVAIAIVNQNDVRTTRRRCAGSGESK